jgi:hypothetical protein
MKTIKIATGIKRIQNADENVTLLKLREILSEHRNALITRLISDLPTYVNYRFNIKVTLQQIESIKNELHLVLNSGINIDQYNMILQHALKHDNIYLPAEPFYKEIDERISDALNCSQLKLVK